MSVEEMREQLVLLIHTHTRTHMYAQRHTHRAIQQSSYACLSGPAQKHIKENDLPMQVKRVKRDMNGCTEQSDEQKMTVDVTILFTRRSIPRTDLCGFNRSLRPLSTLSN